MAAALTGKAAGVNGNASGDGREILRTRFIRLVTRSLSRGTTLSPPFANQQSRSRTNQTRHHPITQAHPRTSASQAEHRRGNAAGVGYIGEHAAAAPSRAAVN